MNLPENFRLKRISYEKRKQQVLFLSYKFCGKSVRLNFTEESIKNCEINQNNIFDILINFLRESFSKELSINRNSLLLLVNL